MENENEKVHHNEVQLSNISLSYSFNYQSFNFDLYFHWSIKTKILIYTFMKNNKNIKIEQKLAMR